MSKTAKIILIISLLFTLICGGLIFLFRDSIIDWLPIDQSGWKEMKTGGICYLDEDGDPIPGWLEIEGNLYYFDCATFAMQTGWIDLQDGRYYLGSDGVRRTGWQTINGKRFYLGDDGIMRTGWLEQADGFLYLNENGNPETGWLELKDGTYYLDENSIRQTGWLELEETRYYLDEGGRLVKGWLELEEGKYYLSEEGILQLGWQTINQQVYYLNDEGIMQTGWIEPDGRKHYLKEDGSAARGKLMVDDTSYYFSSTGAIVPLVNFWNPLPSSYAPDVVAPKDLCTISAVCADAAVAMISDMRAAVGERVLLNGYRSYTTQYNGFFEQVNALTDQGISYAAACRKVREAFAYPGTSEHQLGIALDVMNPTDLYYQKGLTNSIRWLHEHCWEYGFIIRYPEGKSHITGIIYEPWHFRYVGKEAAQFIMDEGLCFEEFLALYE